VRLFLRKRAGLYYSLCSRSIRGYALLGVQVGGIVPGTLEAGFLHGEHQGRDEVWLPGSLGVA